MKISPDQLIEKLLTRATLLCGSKEVLKQMESVNESEVPTLVLLRKPFPIVKVAPTTWPSHSLGSFVVSAANPIASNEWDALHPKTLGVFITGLAAPELETLNTRLTSGTELEDYSLRRILEARFDAMVAELAKPKIEIS